ncbi:methionyl-tRNA formyltransferase [bacterium]|nr:methionyl-tRNA formyltransferase [bacterium]
MAPSFIYGAYRPWNIELYHEQLAALPNRSELFTQKDELTVDRLNEFKPDFVFLPDWSWIVPEEIFSQFMCIVFHAAPLPRYRGGSPLQNQIIRGETETKFTAFIMDGGVDTGDIILQRDLSLRGHLSDIFERMTALTGEMIQEILQGGWNAIPQTGEATSFKRRKPAESELCEEDFHKPNEYLYNFIRMLEDPYPNAWLKIGEKKILFKEAEIDDTTGNIRFSAEIHDVNEQGEE